MTLKFCIKLRALISNNFGRRKNDPVKDRKALETYVSLKGYKHGGNRISRCQDGTLILDEIAKDLNMSTTSLKRALRIERNLTDSMKESLDTIIKNTDLQEIKLPMRAANTEVVFICHDCKNKHIFNIPS